jgi:hypothetical protein
LHKKTALKLDENLPFPPKRALQFIPASTWYIAEIVINQKMLLLLVLLEAQYGHQEIRLFN